ncbi:unnamed protein product [Urochloa humidicola]
MGPMFNVEWSPYEIMAAKSVIARHNPDNNYADETNKKHNAIVNDLQGSKRCSPGGRRVRQFLCGLSLLGRGKWKEISRDYVRTRTPAQISSHAQKYFHRKECTSKKRYSIIDVSLFDDEPWMQNNYAFSQDVPTPGGAHNPNWFGSSSQLDNMNSHAQVWSPFLYNAGQESSNKQVSTWTDQHVGASSSLAPALEETGSHMAWNGNQQGNFIPEEWMDIGNMY